MNGVFFSSVFSVSDVFFRLHNVNEKLDFPGGLGEDPAGLKTPTGP